MNNYVNKMRRRNILYLLAGIEFGIYLLGKWIFEKLHK